jgi:subtilisin-like proprotein convertase family protein/subtilisin family serine protease
MRRTRSFWLVLTALFFVGVFVLLRPQLRSRFNDSTIQRFNAASTTDHTLLTTDWIRNTQHATRLANTSKSLTELARSDHAIILENALLDTEKPIALDIPPSLRLSSSSSSSASSSSSPDTRHSTLSYIAQSRGILDDRFRALLNRSGATVISYIPNNALLIRASQDTAQAIQSDSQTQCVIPYEPYYKLKSSLLKLCLADPGITDTAESSGSRFEVQSSKFEVRIPDSINVLLFPDSRDATISAIDDLGLQILSEDRSPFGPVLKVTLGPSPNASTLLSLSSLSGVQEIEPASARHTANDLTRARIGVAANTTTPDNYLGLTGTNVLVNVNDTGIDAAHPDFGSRIIGASAISLVDSNGHGTHVAGIIAGNGAQSLTVSNVHGSVMPPVAGQFRGQAPAAAIFANTIDGASDSALQIAAAQTNAFISNNSWTYSTPDYDLAAASYDAAVRDALPRTTGSQPLLFVFPAGNAGALSVPDDTNADGSIPSPATAKNVITVGAIESSRYITNKVWQCTSDGTNIICLTNQPWLGTTDSSNHVAAFSRRGNVGIGIEGQFGRFKPDVVAPGSFLVSARSGTWDTSTYYRPDTNGDYSEVLSNLNESLGPYYRYESGSSVSAAVASGALALMQEFLEQRVGVGHSPALMKALLINGARSLGGSYNLQVQSVTNSQGWGLIDVPNSIPAGLSNLDQTACSLRFFDQSPTNALATSQSHTRVFAVSCNAQSKPLRATLVWTDPPGNPAAGLKLVNDLDLIVTNLDTGDVFLGNDIQAGNQFNLPSTNGVPIADIVNNVENVYLAPPLGSNYSVTISAHRVNVNAVTDHPDGIVQDYALVVSSGNGEVADALTLVTNGIPTTAPVPNVTFVSNAFPANPGFYGAVFSGERVGANAPLSGSTNGVLPQWRFYVLTNEFNFTNAAFVTFQATELGLSSSGANQTNLARAARPQADIDLYISTNSALTNLDPAAIAVADKSVGQGGTEFLFYTNAAPAAVYFVGVKSEDQQGAEYSFLGLFSESPFAYRDDQNNLIANGLALPNDIVPGSATAPGITTILALAPESAPLRRVVVTNTITDNNFSNLALALVHNATRVVLDNHSPGDNTTNQTWIFEDNGAGDIPGSRLSDGPGSLRDFIGADGIGLWLLTVSDDSPTNTGQIQGFTLRLEPQSLDVNAVLRSVGTNTFTYDFIDAPLGATNLTVCLSSNTDPVELYVRRGALPTRSDFDKMLVVQPPGDCLVLTLSDLPPLQSGRYCIGAFNPGPDPQSVLVQATVQVDPTSVLQTSMVSTGAVPIIDDAVTVASMFVTNQQIIADVQVGLRVAHPRVSDLVFTLTSPAGDHVVLCENRGGSDTGGFGSDVLVTNVLPQVNSGDFNANTNIIQVGQNFGTLIVNYDFFTLPDTMHVYYDGSLIFDSGLISNGGQFVINFGPGASTSVMILMNEGNNTDTNTAWQYQASVVSLQPSYVVFTDDPAATPIKFASPPFFSGSLSNFYCQPEQSLSGLAGESAYGNWKLEIWDNRAGAASPPPQLLSWDLSLVFENALPPPVITSAQIITNNFCLTWNSLPGHSYYVRGKTNLLDPNWDVISPAIPAPAHQTTWCLPLPSGYQFFRVQQ